MQQIQSKKDRNEKCPMIFPAAIMPAEDNTGWLSSLSLTMPLTDGKGRLLAMPLREEKEPLPAGDGTSGYLKPDALMCVLE